MLDAAPPIPSRSLDQLALSAQRGAPGAVESLVAALLEKLRPIVGYHVMTTARGALTDADIEDVLHDVVILVWRHDLPIFDPRKSGFLTFVNRRLRWHLSDEARRARRRAGEECDDAELEAVVDHGRDPESLLRAHQGELATVHIERIVGAVDPDARAVIVRCDLQGARLVDVARELDLHVSSTCRARQRGLRFLARHLEALV